MRFKRAMRVAMAALALSFLVTGALATYATISTANNFADSTEGSSTSVQNPMHELLQPNGLSRGEDDMGNRIPPMVLDSTAALDPQQLPALDPSTIQITRLTPADRFIRATTPLLAGLTLGVIWLVIFSFTQALQKRSAGESQQAGEIRLG